MSTKKLYHYVYRITNIVINKHYYGKRSSNILPNLDLGVIYFSSSKDKEFIKDQKDNPHNYKYKVISVYSCPLLAVAKEVKLHVKFDVKSNEKFYNRATQTSNRFYYDWTGHTHSAETREKMSKKVSGENNHNYGKPLSESTKEKLRQANLGKKVSEHVKRKLSSGKKGIKNPMSKLANIYKNVSDELVAENVVVSEWCNNNPEYDRGALSKTAYADRSKPSNRKNKHHHKNLYIKYV